MKAADELRADIRRAASARNLKKQEELAGAVNISPTYLSDILGGRRRFPPALLCKIAAVLEVNPARALRWQRLGAFEAGWKIDARMEA